MTFKVAKLPFAVLIDGTGRIRAKGLVNTREQIESLFHAAETGRPSIQSRARAPTGALAGSTGTPGRPSSIPAKKPAT